MKLRLMLLSLLTLCLMVIPAVAQFDVYDNGPTNGTVDAWTINFGFTLSDSFVLNQATTVNGLEFAAWLTPGDVLQTVDATISSDEFGGTIYFEGTVSLFQSACEENQFGFNVCAELGTFADINLNAGAYWLNLQNAVGTTGDPIYWDENDGPSGASETSLGTVPSESFTILGTTTAVTETTSTSPEPSGLILFGSGLLGVAGILRRKF